MMGEPIVTVKQGKLRGVVTNSSLGCPYIAFKNIPFAAPPVGNLRFKDPQPPASWTGIRDATKNDVRSAMQMQEVEPYDVFGTEDCLYLNVYTNSLNQSKPVMFWVHGGAFIVGGGGFDRVRGDYLLPKDVVLVSTNYRLGAFGFLNLGHRVAPGNQGLKDLIAALEWVKENIANFGGDPSNVTIFGLSAGAVLVHALVLSPRAKGLFHKAVMHSGTANSSWSTKSVELSYKFVAALGKDSKDPVEIFEFLQTVPANDIVRAQQSVLSIEEQVTFQLAFGMNMDAVADNPVLPEKLEQLLMKCDSIPMMIGCTTEEFIMLVKGDDERSKTLLNEYLSVHIRYMASLRNLGEADTNKLMETVKEQYFGGKPMNEVTIREVINFLSDVYFVLPTTLLLEDRAKRNQGPNYHFRFSYVGNEKTPTDLLTKRAIRGASHTDDSAYLLYLPRSKADNPDAPAVGTKDRITLERMTRMWTNFAKTGNPTPTHDEFIQTTWKPATKNQFCYLNIGDELKFLPIPPHIWSSETRTTF
ncbi:esterase FE4-like [Xylocopa sonorina]|uniref:esterase FE4-like n=1 Tax=Xylocopa sonorina TaxID=1818115 RepID=UPI00403B1D0A